MFFEESENFDNKEMNRPVNSKLKTQNSKLKTQNSKLIRVFFRTHHPNK
jgi:hypothetical protein